MTVALTVVVIAAAFRVEQAKEVLTGESKFLGWF